MATFAKARRQTETRSRRRIRNFLRLVAILLPARISISAEAQDGVPCKDRGALSEELKTGHAEKPIGLGVTNAGTVVELWNSLDGATWTLLLTMPNGTSCIVSAENGWMASNPDPIAQNF
mgnify:CR=1 FL=1